MQILIDTHYLIWALIDSPKLTEKERELFLNPENEIFYSTISIWEIAIKKMAKASFKALPEMIDKLSLEAGYNEVRLDKKHIFELSSLQDIKNHKDPFDKILLAQAKSEGLKFLTRDENILKYDEDAILEPS